MSANEIHLNDIGTVIEVTVLDGAAVVDVSSATTKEFIFRKPDGTRLVKTATFATNGTDGKLRYTTVAGDLDCEGDWRLQVQIALATGAWSSDIIFFQVYPTV